MHQLQRPREPIEVIVRSHESSSIEVTRTIVYANIRGPSSQSLFPTEETKTIQTVVEVYVDDRFAKLDRTLYDRAAVIGRCVASSETAAIDPLSTTVQSATHPVLHRYSPLQPGVCFVL